jgi:alkylhydroperoxidase/carboxymuconolactone decarboxylase family protein YurZ
MPDNTPVLDTIADMTAASIARSGLEDDELILVRLAALAAMDARPVSYLAHIGAAVESGVTIDRVQDVLTTVAPIVGSARVMSAAINIAEALGFAIAVADVPDE